MSGLLLSLSSERPEWKRSGHFFAIAAALHGAVLFYPLQVAIGRIEVPPSETIMVRLTAAISAEPAKAPPSQPQMAPPQPATTAHKRQAPTPRPVLAMQPEQATAPTSFTVPATPTAPAPAAPSAPTPSAAPVAAISAARFDAAYLNNPKPNYPPISRRLGEEGKVLLRVKVAADGAATEVDLEKSSSFERLDEAARQVVARWRFVPAKRGDQAIEASVIVPIVFRLDS
nr:energy transducer TonB [Dechloromonas sp.]